MDTILKMEQTIDDKEVGVFLTCDQCLEAGETLEAVGYCKDCADFLCEDCFKYHHRPKPWKSHSLLTKDDMPSVKLEKNTNDTNKDETCPEHTGKAVEYYCETDKILGCSVCMTINHRLCEIKHLPNDAENALNMPAYELLKGDIETLKSELHEFASRTQVFKNQAEIVAEAAVKDITTFINDLMIELNKSRKATLAHVEKMKNKDLKYLDNIFKKSGQIEHALKEIETSLSDQHKKYHFGRMYVAVKQGSEAVLLRKQELDNLNTNNTGIIPYTFQPSDTFLDLFRSETKKVGCFTIAKSLSEPLAFKEEDGTGNTLHIVDDKRSMPGEITVQKNRAPDLSDDLRLLESKEFDDPFSDSSKSEVETGGNATPYKLDDLPVCSSGTRVTDINVRDDTDEQTCSITGMTRLNSSRIAICDFQNSCVKIIDTKNICETNIMVRIKLANPPYEVAFTGNALAVTHPYTGKICLITISDDLKHINSGGELIVGADCMGIAFHGKHFYVSFNTNSYKPARIDVINTSGHVVRTFPVVDGESFQHPCHIAVTELHQSLHVSDWQVMNLDFNGRPMQKYCDIDFTELKGITVDRDGNIYVCDLAQDKVYIIYQMVGIKQVFLDSRHGIMKPYSMLVDNRLEKNRQLFVGMDKSDVIKLYRAAWV